MAFRTNIVNPNDEPPRAWEGPVQTKNHPKNATRRPKKTSVGSLSPVSETSPAHAPKTKYQMSHSSQQQKSQTPHPRSTASASVSSHPSKFKYANRSYRTSTPPNRRQQRRANSTSTLFVKHTIDKPDDFLTIKSVAIVIRKLLEVGAVKGGRDLPEFNINHKRLGVTDDILKDLTSVEAINRFIKRIFVKGQLSHECNIMALVYIDRVLHRTGGCLTYRNWRHLVIGAYILASKVWDDLSMINEDFTIVCPMFTLKDINQLELNYLALLEYNVTVSGRLYAEYYFRLRDVYNHYASMMRDQSEHPFPLRPLTREESRKLLLTSGDSESCVKTEIRRRKVTCDETLGLGRNNHILS